MNNQAAFGTCLSVTLASPLSCEQTARAAGSSALIDQPISGQPSANKKRK
jgi:hypothetical protein